MKKTAVTIALGLFLGMASVNSYGQMSTKSTTQEDWQTFKADADAKIKKNDDRIAELKAKKREGTKEVQDKYNKKVADIERKNAELRDRINNYNGETTNEKWNSFKREFNHDMKELGTSIKDIGKDNVK